MNTNASPVDCGLYARSNLVAWCIVPFDAKKRTPEARAEMLERLGFKQFAYDYRAEHIPTFDDELKALNQHHIKLLAWWFPTALNDEARLILEVLKRHHLQTQLWVMGGGEPTKLPKNNTNVSFRKQHAYAQSPKRQPNRVAVLACKS